MSTQKGTCFALPPTWNIEKKEWVRPITDEKDRACSLYVKYESKARTKESPFQCCGCRRWFRFRLSQEKEE